MRKYASKFFLRALIRFESVSLFETMMPFIAGFPRLGVRTFGEWWSSSPVWTKTQESSEDDVEDEDEEVWITDLGCSV